MQWKRTPTALASSILNKIKSFEDQILFCRCAKKKKRLSRACRNYWLNETLLNPKTQKTWQRRGETRISTLQNKGKEESKNKRELGEWHNKGSNILCLIKAWNFWIWPVNLWSNLRELVYTSSAEPSKVYFKRIEIINVIRIFISRKSGDR